MSVTKGLLVRFDALPGKEDDVKEFLDSGRALVEDEQATTAWFAIRLGPTSFGIFDVFPDDAGRELHAVYPLTSITHNRRLRLEVSAPDADPHIPSICDIYPTNDWHERETYDFFGIIFDGHRSLTRIEMPDDWVGHPQRKDYPLGGIPVEYKGAIVAPPDQRRSYN